MIALRFSYLSFALRYSVLRKCTELCFAVLDMACRVVAALIASIYLIPLSPPAIERLLQLVGSTS